jgi:hypothetical protein
MQWIIHYIRTIFQEWMNMQDRCIPTLDWLFYFYMGDGGFLSWFFIHLNYTFLFCHLVFQYWLCLKFWINVLDSSGEMRNWRCKNLQFTCHLQDVLWYWLMFFHFNFPFFLVHNQKNIFHSSNLILIVKRQVQPRQKTRQNVVHQKTIETFCQKLT